jgi:hypothetical protein
MQRVKVYQLRVPEELATDPAANGRHKELQPASCKYLGEYPAQFDKDTRTATFILLFLAHTAL